ncbi:MAG: hypothetical protein V3U54_08710 [Thermodesulfobacteriota bacterium]
MRIVLKGKGRYREVMEQVQKTINNNSNSKNYNSRVSMIENNILEYIVNYLQGSINIEELTYTINGWFVDDNLKVTELIALVQANEKEWRELAKEPSIWFDDYVKELDPTTKKVIMTRAAKPDELPQGRMNGGDDAQCDSSA